MMDDEGNAMGAPLSERDIDRIAERVIERLDLWIDREQHFQDHQWTLNKRKAETENKKSRRRIVETIIGTVSTTGVIMFLAWVGTQVVDFVTKVVGK